MTTFFSNAKLAADIFTFVISLASIIYYAIFFVPQIRTTPWILYLFSLLPQAGINIATFPTVAHKEGLLSGEALDILKAFPLKNSILILFLDALGYFILYAYFD